jgi:hydrogenase nickel incorporation protein HypB
MTIDVLRNVFERNNEAAGQNRAMLDRLGVTLVNVLGGAGSGKTTLLEAVIPALRGSLRVGVLEGDLCTTRDAERIAALDLPVVQLLTDGGCHLNATLVQQGLNRLPVAELDLVIVENVGNPICPANFDLGEHARMAVLSVSEGHDKPVKYPLLFRDATVVVITKTDLLPYTDFDVAAAERDMLRIHPESQIICTAARQGSGVRRVAEWIEARVRERRESRVEKGEKVISTR